MIVRVFSRNDLLNLRVVGDWNMTWIIFASMKGMSSSHLTNSYFSEGLKPPTSDVDVAIKSIDETY